MNSTPAKLPYRFIDSHCHLDANEFIEDLSDMRERAREGGVDLCLIPAVDKNNFDTVCSLAHRFKDVYALGVHPLYTKDASLEDLQLLRKHLARALCRTLNELRDPLPREFHLASNNTQTVDQRLVAIGEIGLDGAVKTLDWSKQIFFLEEQLKLAMEFDLPVVLHVRQAVDFVLKALRKFRVKGGIAHAFNGSLQQAEQFMDLGFKLGMGGALTYPRALHLRRLVQALPAQSIVLETDSPDIVPVWKYVSAELRAKGLAQARNEPSELPKIAQEIAGLRGVDLEELMILSTTNFLNVFNLNVSNLNAT